MVVNFALDEIFGRNPKEVDQLFRRQGLDPARPYTARINSFGVTIEQEIDAKMSKYQMFS